MSVAVACLVYTFAMVIANLTVAAFGPWFSPFNSLLLIGLDLTLRDRLHDAWDGDRLWPKMAVLIGFAGLVSFLLNPAAAKIAIASTSAFIVGGLADTFVYHRLRFSRWGGYMTRTNGSNVAGAVVDSFLFPTLAFGAFLPGVIVAQIAAKVGGGFLWSLALRRKAIA